MARLLHSLVAITFIGLINANAVSSTTSTSPALPSGLEVDIIFPVHNATYNVTKSLPIAFALQNVSAAVALGPFSFAWDIMPWGDVGSNNQVPGGVINDNGGVSFSPGQIITEPYILVAQTDVQNWEYGPRYPWGSVYGLQWFLLWNNSGVCDSAYYGTSGQLFFNINMDAPEPDLDVVTGKCPQIGTVFEITQTYVNSSCSAIVNNTMNGSPCAVKVDTAMVTSISSTVQSMITSSASASSASAASVSAEFARPTPTHHSSAMRVAIPVGELLAATFTLVCVELMIL